MTQTLKDHINDVLKTHSGEVEAVFTRNTIKEIGGTYLVDILWVITGDIPPSQIPELESKTVPLTEDGEYTVRPTFTTTTTKTIDEVMMDPDTVRGCLGYDGEMDTRVMESMKQVFSEVHMDESQLVEFVETDEGTNDLVEFVEVYMYDSDKTKVVENFTDQVANRPQRNGGNHPDEGMQMFIELRFNDYQPVDGMNSKKRFAHVETLTIDGQAYPINIEVGLTQSGKGGRGQWIHTSDFIVEHAGIPKLHFSDEIERINWAEFFASDKPWPEQPGIPEKMPSIRDDLW